MALAVVMLALTAGPVGAGSRAPNAWLQTDMAANQRRCVAAYWHHPRLRSGPHGPSCAMSSILRLLYDSGADVVLAGNDQMYERFAPMNSAGTADAARGSPFRGRHGWRGAVCTRPARPNSEVIESNTYGVLKLTLSWSAYRWEFVAANGDRFQDEGTGTCH